ncbi:glycosyltransferase [Paenibacillus hunanensis]|uniref:glycosyltransferase n=1 Tax=Paenibacillus hunanensis TaxID=539262 RepID=UPI002A6B5AEE|nr:glycosyltransferase [Paenibacillus hunanensis]WPP42080.1 glycosyltransferase [Paenibacillus hunanensis]
MQVSIIIAVYNRASLLPDLLEQWKKVDAHTKYQYELIFSDDESSDHSVDILKACTGLPMRVLENKHGGASRARNHAYQYAKGEIVIFTGDDIFPTLNFVNEHYEAYLKNGSDFATLGCIEWREGIEMNHLMKHITDIGCEQFGFVGMRPFEIVDFRHFYTSNISVAREKLEQLDGLFSLEFKKYGFEDIDLGYRLYKNGLQIIYNPNALAYHDHVYNDVMKFCNRQLSAGEELNTFKRLHPKLSFDEIKVNIDEVHQRYTNYITADKKFDVTADIGRMLIYLMIQGTKIIEKILKKRSSAFLKKVCSKFYSIIFSYYMYLGLVMGSDAQDYATPIQAKRFTFNYLFFGKAQLFFDRKNRFNEHNSVVFRTAGAKVIDLHVDIPKTELGKIRFDALDSFCKVKILKAVAIAENGQETPIYFEYTNATKHTGNQYNFIDQIDPVIISDVLPENTKSVSIKYQMNYLLGKRVLLKSKQAGRLLKKAIKKIMNRQSNHVHQPQMIVAEKNESKRKLWITISLPDQTAAESLVSKYQQIVEAFPDIRIELDYCSSNHYEQYVYALEQIEEAMDRSQFLNVVLCLLEYNYDFVLLSNGLSEFPLIHAKTLKSAVILSSNYSYESLINGEVEVTGNLIRLPGETTLNETKDLSTYIPSLKCINNNLLFTKNQKTITVSQNLHLEPTTHPKPVIFVLPIFMAVGGVERNTIEVMERLKSEYDFVVITFERHRKEQGSLFYQVARLGIDYYDFAEISGFDNYLYLLESLKKMYQPSLVWMCNSSPWTMDNNTSLRKTFNDIPIVMQDVYDYKYGWIEYYDQPAIHAYDRFIAINKKIEDKFIDTYGISAADIDLVYPAADTDKVKNMNEELYSREDVLKKFGLNPERMHFAFIGRFTEQKQPLKMLKLAKYIVENYDNIDFVMVGDGELSTEVDHFVKEYKLTGRVHRIKYIADVFQFVKSIDALFIASIYEGLPIVTIEAMCVGTPIFATDVGDIALFVEEQQSGLISRQDDVNSLTKAIDVFYANLKMYKQNSMMHTQDNIEFFSSARAARLMNDSFKKALQKYR